MMKAEVVIPWILAIVFLVFVIILLILYFYRTENCTSSSGCSTDACVSGPCKGGCYINPVPPCIGALNPAIPGPDPNKTTFLPGIDTTNGSNGSFYMNSFLSNGSNVIGNTIGGTYARWKLINRIRPGMFLSINYTSLVAPTYRELLVLSGTGEYDWTTANSVYNVPLYRGQSFNIVFTCPNGSSLSRTFGAPYNDFIILVDVDNSIKFITPFELPATNVCPF